MDQYIVLVYDEETNVWSVLMAGTNKTAMQEAYDDARDAGTPALIIFTGDYVTV